MRDLWALAAAKRLQKYFLSERGAAGRGPSGQKYFPEGSEIFLRAPKIFYRRAISRQWWWLEMIYDKTIDDLQSLKNGRKSPKSRFWALLGCFWDLAPKWPSKKYKMDPFPPFRRCFRRQKVENGLKWPFWALLPPKWPSKQNIWPKMFY